MYRQRLINGKTAMALEENTEAVCLPPLIDCYNTVMNEWLNFAAGEDTFSKWETRTTLPGRAGAASWDFDKHGLASQRRVQPRTDVHLMCLSVSAFSHHLIDTYSLEEMEQ